MPESNKKKETYTIEFADGASLAADFFSDVHDGKRSLEDFTQILSGISSLLPDETKCAIASNMVHPLQPTLSALENLEKEINKRQVRQL